MSRFAILILFAALFALTSCVSLPNGPSVMVLPGVGLSFDQFRADDALCQQYAFFQTGSTTPNQSGMSSGVTSAVVGTALGAATGAALGNAKGAAIGAGAGLAAGGLIGSSSASSSMYEAQHRYDIAYIQCMYAKGHQVPVSGQFSNANPQPSTTVRIPPPPGSPPPPPPSK